MKDRASRAALQIYLILQEYSKAELAEALRLMDAHPCGDLYSFLSNFVNLQNKEKPTKQQNLSHEVREIKSLRALKETEPERHALILELYDRIRTGNTLGTLDEIRVYGRMLSKDFIPGKSRKEAISRLISYLATLDTELLKTALSKVPVQSRLNDGGEQAFKRLAEYIITGKSPTEKKNDCP